MKGISKMLCLAKLPVLIVLLAVIFLAEGCWADYKLIETNGHVYVQRKSWWEKNIIWFLIERIKE